MGYFICLFVYRGTGRRRAGFKEEIMYRSGIGFDVHAFSNGRPLVLGGVTIEYDKGLDGHSDADVLVHAVMDALLGAAGLGDIGRHFPDTDPAHKGRRSIDMLGEVSELIGQYFDVVNIDSVLILQQPKVAKYIEEMKVNLSGALNIEPVLVNIKATTTEKLGFTGRGEGVAAEAVVMLRERIKE